MNTMEMRHPTLNRMQSYIIIAILKVDCAHEVIIIFGISHVDEMAQFFPGTFIITHDDVPTEDTDHSHTYTGRSHGISNLHSTHHHMCINQ